MSQKSNSIYIADLDYFQAILEKEPQSINCLPVALFNLIMGNNDEVIRVCREGLKYFPDFSQLKVIYANGLINIGDHENALDLLLDVIVSDPDNYLALKLVGVIYKETDNTKEAIKYIRAGYFLAKEDDQLASWLKEVPDVYNELRKSSKEDNSVRVISEGEYVLRDINSFLSEVTAIIDELQQNVATAKKTGKKPDDILLSVVDTVKEKKDHIVGKELSDEEIYKALANISSTEDSFDTGDMYDFNKGVKILDPVQVVQRTMIKSSDFPFLKEKE